AVVGDRPLVTADPALRQPHHGRATRFGALAVRRQADLLRRLGTRTHTLDLPRRRALEAGARTVPALALGSRTRTARPRRRLARLVRRGAAGQSALEPVGMSEAPPIAIVGMAGRFPGAADIDRLWELLLARGDAITPVPEDRWDAAAPLDDTRRVQAVGGFLPEIDRFDAALFGISPREAADIDPQQRVVLETVWRTLEDGGAEPTTLRGRRIGVYMGASWHDFEIGGKEGGAPPTPHGLVGSALDVIAARVSYTLGLTGRSMTVETGCSSALVALDLAVRAIRTGDIEAAVVGGVNLLLAPDVSIGLTHFGGLSENGRCAAFGADADGFVRGEGVAAVYLKALPAARADGDRVRAVVLGTMVNNDGGDSLVTPSR